MRRSTASAAILVFLGVFFALPLHAAMSMCAMSCCAQSETKLTAGAMDCQTECAIRASEVTPSQSVTIARAPHVALVATVVIEPVAGHAHETIVFPHREAPRSLSIASSVLRI